MSSKYNDPVGKGHSLDANMNITAEGYDAFIARDKANRARLHAQLLIIAIIIGLYSCIAAICYLIAIAYVPVWGGLAACTGLVICSFQQFTYFGKL